MKSLLAVARPPSFPVRSCESSSLLLQRFCSSSLPCGCCPLRERTLAGPWHAMLATPPLQFLFNLYRKAIIVISDPLHWITPKHVLPFFKSSIIYLLGHTLMSICVMDCQMLRQGCVVKCIGEESTAAPYAISEFLMLIIQQVPTRLVSIIDLK